MIYTLTANPALDYRMEMSDVFTHGKLNRAHFTKMRAGGKGINVSTVLKNLGVETTALGFIGGYTGEYFKQCVEEKNLIPTDFVTIEEFTRINVKLSDSMGESEINAPGPTIDENAMNALMDKIKTLKTDDVLVLAGSQGQGEAFTYERLAKFAHTAKIDFVVDIDHGALLSTLPYQPLLVKPNIHELRRIMNRPIETDQAIIDSAKWLIASGAQNVIVSMGEAGAMFINQSHVYKAAPLKGVFKNAVGAGDSMVAGFLKAYSDHESFKDTFKWAVACGSATAFSHGLASNETIHDLMEHVTIEEVNQ